MLSFRISIKEGVKQRGCSIINVMTDENPKHGWYNDSLQLFSVMYGYIYIMHLGVHAYQYSAISTTAACNKEKDK